MAKKKANSKARKKAPAVRAGKGRVKAAVRKALKKQLRQPTLNGMPRVRNARLDKLAEAIGECRDTVNEKTLDEKGYRSAALKEMQDKNITHWSHAGVDFLRVPGEDKLKVKTHKDGGSETGSGDEDDEVDPPSREASEAVGDDHYDIDDPEAGDTAGEEANP